jgi:hypothetical protein
MPNMKRLIPINQRMKTHEQVPKPGPQGRRYPARFHYLPAMAYQRRKGGVGPRGR